MNIKALESLHKLMKDYDISMKIQVRMSHLVLFSVAMYRRLCAKVREHWMILDGRG